MGVEEELARAGIVVTDSEIILTRDVRFGEHVNIDGDISVGENSTVDGDLMVGGAITGELAGKYRLQFDGFVVSGANSVYVVIPTDGAGKISHVRWVVTVAITDATGAVTALIVGGSAISPANEVSMIVASIGDTGATAFAATLSNITVAAGDAIKLTSDGGATAGAVRGYVEITRT